MKERELSYKALLYMDKMEVVVKDLENDIYDQICVIKVKKDFITQGKKGKEKVIEVPSGIILYNEEYIFEYDWSGKCLNGEFKVYSYCHKNIKEIHDV